MRYGHFDDEAQEYVLDRPDPPLPWINYIGCEAYFGLVSQTGGGYAFQRDARLRRLTRYRYNSVPPDGDGRHIYLRDDGEDAGPGPRVWTPTWLPMRSPLQSYECRHGLGYTTIRSATGGIETSIRYFVPLGESLEIWHLTLTNRRPVPARLSLVACVEFCLWDAWDDATNFQRNYSIGEVEVVDGVIYHVSEYRERRNHFAYFAASEPVVGFDTQREAFLGAYRGWDSPAALEGGELSGSIAHGWQPIGALQMRIDLQPHEPKPVVVLLGYQENPVDEKFEDSQGRAINKRRVLPTIARYRRPENVSTAFLALRAHWTHLRDSLQVTTPDPHTNRMVNIWNPYQVMTTFNLSRSASYFESGIGRGMGFRDSCQDLLGFVQLDPLRARQRILDLAATQLPSGAAYHQYQPLTQRGNDAVGSGFNDDPLWLVLAVAAYLKETGDWDVLQEQAGYDNQPGTEEALFGHLRRSIQHTLDRLGPHALPLIGRADWNDCLNLNCFSEVPGESFQTAANRDGRVAESVLIAGLFVLAASELQAIGARLGQPAEAERCAAATQAMEAAIWSAGWDGDWFRRAYDSFGRPLGSRECDEGRIFIEPQGLCVMAGLGLADGRAQRALDAVAAQLATPHGIVLLQPAFQRYQLHLGEISSYPPGYKENASVFCHTNPWIMIAEAMIGRGDRAHDYYLRINPSAREEISDVHRCEPYVYAQMIAGKDAPTPGEAKNAWLTGTASWSYVAITQWILGIRPTYDGLRIAPVIPAGWRGFDAVRRYRGKKYTIHVERNGPGNTPRLEVNGVRVDGDIVPLPIRDTDGVAVRVLLE
jgi:cellobiose phosphorylase